jgi:type I restriction enzyme S subunit
MINKNELPKNWEVKKLSEIADKITDGTHHTPTYTETGIPFISVKDIRDQKVYFDNCKYISAAEHEELIKRCNPEEGDLLITKSGTIGRLAIVPKVDFSLFVSVALIKLQKNKRNINQKWMLYFFEFHIAFLDIKSKIKGGVVKNYHLEDLRQVEIPLPPFAEQERIVAKIEELFSELDAGLENLKTAQAQLKIYRQAVLKYAFEGKFTNDDVNEGELPNGWKWVKLNEICKIVGGVTKGRNFKEKETIFLPYLRVANVQDGYLNLNEIKQIEVLSSDKSKYRLEFGDILYTEGGDKDKLGRGTIWRNEIEDCIHQNHIFRARPICRETNSKYIAYFSRTNLAKDYFFKNGKQTTNLASINLTVLSNLPVPFCSNKEQQRIVEEIESRLSVCDKLEETIYASLKQTESLRQSILKQVFEGKLVKPKEIEKPKRTPFYQMQTLGLIVNRSKQRNIRHGEMTLAKYAFLADKIYGVPIYENYQRWHLGPYPTEIKKNINNKEYFKIENNTIRVLNEEKLFKYHNHYKEQIESAVDELAEIFSSFNPKDRPHKTELLATVCKVIEDIQTTEIEAVRKSMSEWKIELRDKRFNNKAEKFNEDETAKCVEFIVKKGWDKKLINQIK